MVRGLHFHHTGEALPEKSATVSVHIFAGESYLTAETDQNGLWPHAQ